MESLKFTITTKMEKEDLKIFMYIATFFQNEIHDSDACYRIFIRFVVGKLCMGKCHYTRIFCCDNNYAYIYYRSYFLQDRKKSETVHKDG